MSKPVLTFDTLKDFVGKELGVSGWITVDQAMINQFADCTGDRQWIHIDVERARRESPFRTPIAHGYLTLSLVAALAFEIGAVPEDTQAAFNYGLDRVRFITPVRAGSRIRLKTTLMSVEDRGPGQYLTKTRNSIEIEGDTRPALIAETLVMLYRRRRKPADQQA